MELFAYDYKPVRLKTTDGETFEGLADVYSAEFSLHEFGREEDSVRFGCYQIYASQILSIEEIDPALLCGFWGAERASEEIRALYRDLKCVWCAETCAPRLRPGWSPDNPSLGQCSITAFLVQDLFGGKVFGVPLPEGGVHCFNEVGDHSFDLASEQFGDEELDYWDCPEQFREDHFADADKRARYELLKRLLAEFRASKEAERC